jgi:hypothetical protein
MLAAEELLDVTNRATMKDDRVHPTSRRIAKIHVMEEARHVSYARTYVAELWPTLSWVRRVVAMVRAPFVVSSIADALVNPQVYDELGIEGGASLARHNPAHQERVVRDLAKLTDFLEEIGVINVVTRPVWRGLGLIGAVDDGSIGRDTAAAAGPVVGVVGAVVDQVAVGPARRAARAVAATSLVGMATTAWTLAGGASGFRLS